MKSSWRKVSYSLFPIGDDAETAIKRLKEGEELVLDIKRSRNPKFHRYAMAMFSRLHEMSDEEAGFSPWRRWLLIQAGYCSTTGFSDGSVHVDADSMSWDTMYEDQFQECWKDLHATFCRIYGKKLTLDQLTEWSVM